MVYIVGSLTKFTQAIITDNKISNSPEIKSPKTGGLYNYNLMKGSLEGK